MPDYPEHEKLSAVKGECQTIGEFMRWLQEAGVWFARHHHHTDECEVPCDIYDGKLVPIHRPIESWLAEYFGIDEDRLEEEKKAMLRIAREGTDHA